MAMDTSGFVPKGNLNTDAGALKNSGKKETVRRVLSFLKNYRISIIISLMLAFVSVLFTLLVPIMIGHAIDGLGKDNKQVLHYLMLAAIFAVTVGVSQFVMNLINNSITYKTVRDIRNEIIAKMVRLPLRFIDSHSQGDIASRVVADADQFADGLLLGFTQAFTGIMTIIGTLFFMLSMNIVITVAVVLITPLSIFIARFISSHTYKMFARQSMERGELTGLIDELIGNEKTVKAFSREKQSLERFDEINERLTVSSVKAIFFSSLTNPCTRFVNAVCYAAVAFTGALFCIGWMGDISGSITVGTLTVFLAYANQYTKPFNEISSVISELQSALACAARVFEVMDEEIETDDEEAKTLADCKGDIEVDNVRFSYSADKELIKDFNISVKKGQRVAIVGPTGCGKTTIINLLMRFYDVDGGRIRIDGGDIRSYTRNSLRGSYGMVLQDTWLRHGTVMDNLRLGNPHADDEEVIEAAKACHAHGFIRRLEKGYDTDIGEDGGELSVGQKQLLCITRAMLSQPSMLILDEATSSIDVRTEMMIGNAFEKLMKDRTSFIVAHRLTTVMNADIILVMRDGRMVEQGNHETLMAQKGFYSQLFMAGCGDE